jgi:hypothetical protein
MATSGCNAQDSLHGQPGCCMKQDYYMVRRAMNCAGKKWQASDSNHAFGMKPWKKKLN